MYACIYNRPQNPLTSGVLVPALGPASADLALPPSGLPTFNFELPPSPALPSPPPLPYPQVPRTYQVDPEMLKPEVIQDLELVEKAWRLPIPSSSPSSSSPEPLTPDKSFDVLGVLKTTTRAIRSVRNYLVSLPDDHPSHQHRSEILASFRRTVPSRRSPLASTSSPSKSTSDKTVPFPSRPLDPLSLIRRSALEVLGVLRDLEEASRLPVSDDPFDDISTGSPRHGEDARSVSEVSSRSITPAGGSGGGSVISHRPSVSPILLSPSIRYRYHDARRPNFLIVIPLTLQMTKLGVSAGANASSASITVWSDSDNDDDMGSMSDSAENRREPWDDRLVLGGGWLYKQDIDPASLSKEREVVGKYLDVVDEVLFGGAREVEGDADGGRRRQRGWERVKAEGLAKLKSRGRASMGGPGSKATTPRISRSPSPFRFPRLPREDPSSSSLQDESTDYSTTATPQGRRILSPGLVDVMRDAVGEFDEEGESVSEERGFGSLSGSGLDMLDEEDEGVPDEDLPEWARRDRFDKDSLGSLHFLILLVSYSLL